MKYHFAVTLTKFELFVKYYLTVGGQHMHNASSHRAASNGEKLFTSASRVTVGWKTQSSADSQEYLFLNTVSLKFLIYLAPFVTFTFRGYRLEAVLADSGALKWKWRQSPIIFRTPILKVIKETFRRCFTVQKFECIDLVGNLQKNQGTEIRI